MVRGHLTLALELVGEMEKGNSFSFGVAQNMRTAWGDGFGKEKTSVGFFQQCDGSDPLALWDTLNGARTETPLGTKLKKGDVVSLVLGGGVVEFSINGKRVATRPAPGGHITSLESTGVASQSRTPQPHLASPCFS